MIFSNQTIGIIFSPIKMTAIKYILFCLISFALITSFLLAWTPLIIPLGFLFMSAITYIVYARDKYAAIHNEGRIPENILHIFSLLGGWPGAIIAQQTLRHKTRKPGFQLMFWLVMLINSAFLIWLHTNEGNSELLVFITALDNLIRSEFATNKFSNALLYLLQYRAIV